MTYSATPCRDRYLAAKRAYEAALADDSRDDVTEEDQALEAAARAYRESLEPRTWVFDGDAKGAPNQFDYIPSFTDAARYAPQDIMLDGSCTLLNITARCEETLQEERFNYLPHPSAPADILEIHLRVVPGLK